MADLYDRDTVCGAEVEQLMALFSPTRYPQERLEQADYWDIPVVEQTRETAGPRVCVFVDVLPSR